ncbi:MAG TPA: response regulator [Burkholderiales bacterium]|nr:response regulator [Burkholderiales bacterium]
MSSADKAAPRHRILIVDDEEATRLLLARILTTELRLEVQLAGTCEQALRLAEEYAYDAILLDLLMPGIGGLAVLKEIRAHPPNMATPVVIVTVVSDPKTREQCMKAGANAYLVKPIERGALAAAVKAQIDGRKRGARTKH